MKTTEKRMTRCALYAVWALTATALTGCSEELSQMFSEKAPSPQDADIALEVSHLEVEGLLVPRDVEELSRAGGLVVGDGAFHGQY